MSFPFHNVKARVHFEVLTLRLSIVGSNTAAAVGDVAVGVAGHDSP